MEIEILNDVLYGMAGRDLLFLDLYRPDPMPAKSLPVIIYIHGGMWRRGDKAFRTLPPLLETGNYCLASINYRYSNQAIFPAQLHDCKAAVRWLRANAQQYGLDHERIGVWGHSAGGHLAALLGVTGNRPELEGASGLLEFSSAVQAVVAVAAPSDFTQMGGWHNDADSPESMLVGGALAERQELVQLANPITHVHADAPPFLIIHGDNDEEVPYIQSVLLHNALQEASATSTLRIIEDAGHSFHHHTPYYAQVNQEIQAFFDAHLLDAPRHP